jgi:hypothetical protein
MIETLKQAYQLLLTEPHAPTVCEQLEVILRQAIAELESQEPFAWLEFDGNKGYFLRLYEDNESYAENWNKRNPNHIGWVKPLYKHPPQRKWVGLTDEELVEFSDMELGSYDLCLEVEAKLKEKNT